MNRLVIHAVVLALAFGAPPAIAQDYSDLEATMDEGIDAAESAKDRANALANTGDDAGYCTAVKDVSDGYWAAIVAADELHDNLESDGAYNEAETLADLIRTMLDEATHADDVYESAC